MKTVVVNGNDENVVTGVGSESINECTGRDVAEKYILYTYRYMMILKEGEAGSVCVKIVTDLKSGHDAFVKRLLQDDSIGKLAREYVCEYDCRSLGVFENLTPIASLEESERKAGL